MNTNLLHGLLILLVASWTFFSCEKRIEEFPEDQLGYEYFPLELGKYSIYRIDSVIYQSGGNLVDTIRTYSREEIVELIQDLNGDTLYRIERSLSDIPDGGWEVKDVWTASKNETQALWTEENLKFIKIVFPLLEDNTWDGNIYFEDDILVPAGGDQIKMYDEWTYRVLGFRDTANIESVVYEDLLKIQQVDTENLLERRYGIEYYARNVGLVKKELQILDTQCVAGCEGMTWEEKAEKGFIINQVLIDHN